MTALHVLYRAYDGDDTLLYVGVTLNVAARFSAHRQERDWWRRVATIRLQHFDTREALEEAEREAIREEQPVDNHLRYRGPRAPRVTPERREANRRRKLMSDAQQDCFRAIRKVAHDPPRARRAADVARDAGLSEDDVAWALAHPIRYWGPATNHPQARHDRTSGA